MKLDDFERALTDDPKQPPLKTVLVYAAAVLAVLFCGATLLVLMIIAAVLFGGTL